MPHGTLDLFEGNYPTPFENWYEKTSNMLGISRPDIHKVIEGQIRPTEETSAEEAPPAQRQATYERVKVLVPPSSRTKMANSIWLARLYVAWRLSSEASSADVSSVGLTCPSYTF